MQIFNFRIRRFRRATLAVTTRNKGAQRKLRLMTWLTKSQKQIQLNPAAATFHLAQHHDSYLPVLSLERFSDTLP
jgi:hypothetical protein